MLVSNKKSISVNGVKITPREIEVISCIINVRGAKKIATILSISLRTVERHIHNIMLKSRCNSQEGIKDFVEKSENFLFIKQHYSYLLVKSTFIQQLKKVSFLIRNKNISCFIKYEQSSENIDLLIKYLELSGIKIIAKQEDLISSKLYILNILSKESVCKISPKDIKQSNNLYISFDHDIRQAVPKELDDIDIIIYKNHTEYYCEFFKILALLSNIDLQEFVLEFKKISCNNVDLKTDIAANIDSIAQSPSTLSLPPSGGIAQKLTNRVLLIFFSCVFIVIIGLSFGFLKKFTILPLADKIKQISSNLSLPHDGILLNRTEILNKIEKSFKNNLDNIQTVVILGPGGIGKTTLARQFTRKQGNSIIWEINAEGENNLILSFEQLANFLCFTSEEKEELRSIQDIEEAARRNKKILFFVQERLQDHPNWLLIFDNVEDFKYIQQYFPYDVKAWGKGKIIITTRDSNIINNSYIASTNVIQIQELSKEEKLQLFVSFITEGIDDKKLSYDNEDIKRFLEQIPSFPLDIITAYYYIKETGITYDKYIELINTPDQSLALTQENILKEVSQYYKTRYGIIALSLKHIIAKNPDFQDLLLFISLINSYNIPLDLLSSYKDHDVVNNFIIELKRLSFVTNNRLTGHKVFTFSIHRSTQSIILRYLVKSLKLDQDKEKISLVAEALVKYMHQKSLKYYPEELQIFIAHAQMLLKHQSLLSEIAKATISERLGSYYYYLGDYKKAKELTEQALLIYEKQLGEKDIIVAKTLVTIGRIYSEIGNYEVAEKYLTKGYLIYKDCYGNDNPETAKAKFRLAVAHKHVGLYSRAQKEIEEILQVYKKNYGEDNKKTAQALVTLSSVYKHMGFVQESITLLEQVLMIFKKHYGEDHIKVARILVILADAYKTGGLYTNAKAVLEEGHSIYKKHYNDDSITIAWTSVILSSLYKDLGNYNKSIEILENSLIVYKRHYGYNHNKTARVIRDLGAIFMSSRDLKRAEALFNEALEISKKTNHPDQFKSLELLAELNIIRTQESENSEQKSLYKLKAFDYFTQALEIARQSLPSNSPYIEIITSKLSQFVE